MLCYIRCVRYDSCCVIKNLLRSALVDIKCISDDDDYGRNYKGRNYDTLR
jgi:hypothetical protein